MRADWAPLLGLVAAITIMVGNWAAVTQENSKRLLAYSSISNAGYLLLGLVAGNAYGYTGLMIYLLVYTLMNMGAFGIIISLRRRGIIGDNVDDMTGLAQKAPGMAAMMAIFMLSLGGLPMTGGFIGKYFLFGGLLQRGEADGKNWYYWLAVWAIINTVVSFYYYIRFIKVMYLGDHIADDKPLALSPALQTALVVSLVGIIFIGIYPQPLIRLLKVCRRLSEQAIPITWIHASLTAYRRQLRVVRCMYEYIIAQTLCASSISLPRSLSGWAFSRFAVAFVSQLTSSLNSLNRFLTSLRSFP